jgi:hypothetical protein
MKNYKIIHTEKIIPDAYHGTKAKDAENICSNGFNKSTGEKQFLGDGVYFFESSKAYAEDWARNRFKCEIIGVVKSTVSLGRCLDLNDKEHKDYVEHVVKELKERGMQEITDSVAISFIATVFEELDSVRATYISPKYKKIFKGSHFYKYSQLIICIRNLRHILKISLVYKG